MKSGNPLTLGAAILDQTGRNESESTLNQFINKYTVWRIYVQFDENQKQFTVYCYGSGFERSPEGLKSFFHETN